MRLLSVTKTADVRSLAFAPDGSLLAVAGMNANVRVWDTASERPVYTLKNTRYTSAAAFAGAADRLVVCNFYGGVDLWRLPPGPPVRVVDTGGSCLTVCVSPDGSRLVRADWPAVHCHDTADGRTVWTFDRPGRAGSPLFAAAGARVFLVNSERVTALDASDGREGGGFEVKPTRWFGEAAVSPDCGRLAVTTVGGLQVLDAATGAVVFADPGPKPGPALAFTPDGATLAAGASDGGRIDFWDTGSWARQPSLDFGGERVTALTFSPDGLLGAAGSRGRVAVWDVG